MPASKINLQIWKAEKESVKLVTKEIILPPDHLCFKMHRGNVMIMRNHRFERN